MTNAVAAIPTGAAAPPGVVSSPASVTPTFARRVLGLAFAGVGARIGLAWIAVIAFLAVFAPLIASSHPLAMKVDGRWTSPWLANLTPTDVTLFVASAAAVGLAVAGRRWTLRSRALTLLAIVGVTGSLAWVLMPAPGTIWYARYRVDLAAGRAQAAYFAPIRYSPEDRLRDAELMDNLPPSPAHPMGTSADAADVAATMIYATRVALSIGFVSTGVAVVLGVVMGGVMGYFGGWVDLLGMRLVEVFESIPQLLLLIAFAPLFQQAGGAALYIMMAVLGFLASFGYAEFVRAEFLTLRNRDFVHAARAAGLRLPSILFRHILPNGLTPVIVNVSFGIAGAILTETAITFLGIGLKTDASWGNLLNQALGVGGRFYWWLAVYPGAAIFLTVFSYNLIGEALRDALDPRLVQNK